MDLPCPGQSGKISNNSVQKKILDSYHDSKIRNTFSGDKINVLCTNVRSLTSGVKREELQLLVISEKIAVLGLTETWGKPDILDSEMEIPGFKLYRKDRGAINNKKRRWCGPLYKE